MLIYIALSSFSLLTASLNLLVIISISHFRQLHTPTNLLLLSLAVADFLVSLFVIPFQILLTEPCWFLGDLVCGLVYFITSIILLASILNIVFISVDRYVAICRYNSCYGECVININSAVDIVLCFILPISAIIILYMRVFVVAVSQARAMRSHIAAVTLQCSVTVTAKKSELKAARNLGVLVAVFLMCYCPYYCVSLIGSDLIFSSSVEVFMTFIICFNSCLNPVIYAFFYPWFRKSVKLIASLQGCLEATEWNIFEGATDNIHEYAEIE
uniref:trace amine-associated receptor 13c-like n=1 Tax=Monopterus albus TaxID=43700 RepID=UPI0009B45297|nr:trace amine-associated receptor 13c-like [Monopterus albus]